MLRRASFMSSASVDTHTSVKQASKLDFQKVYVAWKHACEQVGAVLSKQCIAEFNKRIQSCSKGTGKAKLDFRGCSLDDQKTTLLIEALAVKPVIAKLDLSDNADLTEQSLRLLLRLLKGQVSLVRKVHLDDRLHVTFLGEVVVAVVSALDRVLLEDIRLLSEILHVANVQADIRSMFLESYHPEATIDIAVVSKMWVSFNRSKPDRNKLLSMLSQLRLDSSSSDGALTYSELESILLNSIVQRGGLPSLNMKQVRLLTTESTPPPPVSRPSPEDAGSYGPTTHTRRVDRSALDDGAGAAVISSGSPTTQEAASATNSNNKPYSKDDAIAELSQHPVSKESMVRPRPVRVQMVIPDDDLLSPAPTAASRKDPLLSSLEDSGGGGVYDGGSSVTLQTHTTSIDVDAPFYIKKSPPLLLLSIVDQGLHSATTASLSNNDSPDNEVSDRMDPPHGHDASYAMISDATAQCADSPVIVSIRCIEAPRMTNGLVQTRLDYHRTSIPTHEDKDTAMAAADAGTSPDHPLMALRYSNANTSLADRDEESRSTAINADRPPVSINHADEDKDGEDEDRDPSDPPPPQSNNFVSRGSHSNDRGGESFEEGFRQYANRLDGGQGGPDENRSSLLLLLQDKPSESTFIRRYSSDDAPSQQYFSHCHSKQSSEDLIALLDCHTTASLKVLVLRGDGMDMQQCEALQCTKRFPLLTDLDLGYNSLTGAMRSLPLTLLRLDLSRNKIANIAALMVLVDLQELNVSHNLIKTFHGLPSRLRRVDLSHNLIRTSNTLRALALSPGIASIHIHHNEVTTEGLQWKVVLRSILTQLVEIDGKSLPILKSKSKSSGGGGGGGAQCEEKRRSTISKEQQRMGDAMRTRSYHNSINNHSKKSDDNTTTRQQQPQQLVDKDSMHAAKRVVLQPKQMGDLMRRLTSSSSSSSSSNRTTSASSNDNIERSHQYRQSADIIAKISAAASRHLQQQPQQHNSYHPPSSATPFTHPSQSFSSSDVDLSAWVTKSKHELRKGVALIARAVALSRKPCITNEDLMKYSHAVHSVGFYSNHDLPLKVEYAIKKLMVSDALFRRVSEVRGHVERVAMLLHQVETAVLLSMKGAFALADSLDILMTSNAGMIKNIRLLKLYGFDYSAARGDSTEMMMMILEHDDRRSIRSSGDVTAVDPSSVEEEEEEEEDLDARFDREVGAYYRAAPLLDTTTSSGDDEFSYRVISPSSSPKHLRVLPGRTSIEANERRQVVSTGSRSASSSSSRSEDPGGQLLDRVRNRVASRMQDPLWTAAAAAAVDSSELDHDEMEEEEEEEEMMRAGGLDSSDRLSAVLLEVAKVNSETEQFLEDITYNNNYQGNNYQGNNNNKYQGNNNINYQGNNNNNNYQGNNNINYQGNNNNNNYQGNNYQGSSNNNREESGALPHKGKELSSSSSTRASAAREECIAVAPVAPVNAAAVNAGCTDDITITIAAESILPPVMEAAEVKLSAKDRLKLRVSSRRGSSLLPLEELPTQTESSDRTEAPSGSSASISTDSTSRDDALVQHPPIQQLDVKASIEPLSVPESFLLGTIPMVQGPHDDDDDDNDVVDEDLHRSNVDVDYNNDSHSSGSYRNDTTPPPVSSSSEVDVRRKVLQPQTSAHDEVVLQTTAHDEVVLQTTAHDEVVLQTTAHNEVVLQTSPDDEDVLPLVESKVMTAKERLLARMAKNKK